MKKKIISLSAVLIIISMTIFVSCDEALTKVDTKPAESALNVMKAFSDIILSTDDNLVPDSAKSGMKIAEEYTETITGDFPSKLLTWDFGTDGDYQGIMYVLLTDEYTNPNAVIQISFENFLYKGKAVDGLVTIENLGKNADDMDELTVELNEAKVGTHTLSTGWTLQRTEGSETPVQSDDIFTLSQIDAVPATGITDEGVEYTMTIIEGIRLDLTCEYVITKGIFEILQNGTTVSADFGDGECDNLVKASNGLIKADIFF